MTRRSGTFVAGVGVVLLLAGCGGGSGGSATGTTVAAPTPSAGSSGAAPPVATTGASSPAAADQSPVPAENNPPGDIPDNVAFVPYRNRTGRYGFTFPEGWARTEHGTGVTFTDKLNGIAADSAGVPSDLSVAAVKATVVAALTRTQAAFELRTVSAVTLPAGRGVRVVYRRNSAPDPVTGRRFRDEVESFLVAAGGRRVRLDLFGPVGADNVDAYQTISSSLAFS